MPGSSGVQSWFPGGQRWTAPAHVMAGARCPDENDSVLCGHVRCLNTVLKTNTVPAPLCRGSFCGLAAEAWLPSQHNGEKNTDESQMVALKLESVLRGQKKKFSSPKSETLMQQELKMVTRQPGKWTAKGWGFSCEIKSPGPFGLFHLPLFPIHKRHRRTTL